MFERFKALRVRLRELAEIQDLSEADLNDLALSRDQLRALVEIPPDVADRVARMAQIFGLTPEDLTADRGEYVDVLATCSTCQTRAECAHEMAKGDAADAENCGFCVNAGTFARHSHA
jgi:hypothetical protein